MWAAARWMVAGLVVWGAVVLAPGQARADEPFDVQDVALRAAGGLELKPGFGLRVGGYGMRMIDEEGVDWLSCRMDGLGVFGTMSLTPWAFAELSFDIYQATSGTVEEQGVDRVSFELLAAMGLRAFPEAVVSPFVQIGVGVEHSHIELMQPALEEHGFYPLGFVGTGAEVEAGDHFRLGLNLRLYGMAATVAVREEAQSGGGAPPAAELEAEAGLAGQLQLWVRYDL